MARSTATVSGRTLDSPEFIGDAGLKADPEVPDKLAAQIVSVLSGSRLPARLEREGLKKSAACPWEGTARKTGHVYRLPV